VKGSPAAIPYVLGGFGPVIGAIVVTLLTWQRNRPADQSSVHVDPHAHQAVTNSSHQISRTRG